MNDRPTIVRRNIHRRASHPTPPDFALGLDLGQAQDHTAIVVVQRINPSNDTEAENCRNLQNLSHYRVRHIERFPLGTSYPDILDEIEQLLQERPLAGRTRRRRLTRA